MKCSICKNDLEEIKDFGKHPLSNNLLSSETEITKKYPLVLGYCKECELLQLTKKLKSEILFDRNYPYKSGVSERFIEHCKTFAESLKTNLPLDILEIRRNDGTLAKETTRAKEVSQIEKELNTALLSKYNPNKPEATKGFLDRAITQGKITKEE